MEFKYKKREFVISEELESKLRRSRVLTEYVKEVKDQYHTFTTGYHLLESLTSTIYWRDTSKGVIYWESINRKFYDKD